MRLLCALARLEGARGLGEELGPPALGDVGAHVVERVLRDAHGVGAHVGDQTDGALGADVDPLVELLGDSHRAPVAETELARGILLQRGGDERRRRVAALLAALDVADRVVGALQIGDDGARLVAGLDLQLLAGLLDQLRLEGELLVLRREERGERPVLFWYKGLDLPLAVDNQADRHRLDAAGAQVALDLLPEKGAEVVADEAVHHPPRLLGIDAVHVEAARVLQRVAHGARRDLVELDAQRVLQAERLLQVPGDRLALPVRVGRQVDAVGLLHGAAQVLQRLLAVGDLHVGGLEIALDANAEACLRQIAHVAHRGHHLIAGPEEALQALRLRRRLHYDQ
ncbi:MAG: hypothetical protein BWZ09_02745 [Alphaproteobacteria bacterium ADurb.BinA305]|nr:MAG: hypothetical protein BWZ09_02745 [Alphaproteobacteria bacterium ADurb.BinA305]